MKELCNAVLEFFISINHDVAGSTNSKETELILDLSHRCYTMWGVDFEEGGAFIYSVFGLQYETSFSREESTSLLTVFNELITASAPYLDNIIQDGPGEYTTRIWLAYWPSPEIYSSWWESAPVKDFWAALPEDAGVWREVMTVSGRRTQFGTNKEQPNGLGSIAKMVPNTDKIFYWGCYRDRILEGSTKNRLTSPLKECPARNASLENDGTHIRLGHHNMTTFPDNLCFVVEGQDHSLISDAERQHWFDNFDGLVTRWMGDLQEAGPKAGILDAKLCYSGQSGTYREAHPAALNYNKKIQLFYFLDLQHMERIGRVNKGHVELRDSFMKSYCPVGPMGKDGQLTLWVETSVLKSNEIEAEYVGCVEGTGFMAYDQHNAFGCSTL